MIKVILNFVFDKALNTLTLQPFSGTFYNIQKFVHFCGSGRRQADLILNDLTIKQCMFFTKRIPTAYFINYGTHCLRLYHLPRYGFTGRQNSVCSFLVTGRKDLHHLSVKRHVIDCMYTTSTAMHDLILNQQILFVKTGKFVRNIVEFSPNCSYVDVTLDTNTIYQYSELEDSGLITGSEEERVHHLITDIGSNEGHYSLESLVLSQFSVTGIRDVLRTCTVLIKLDPYVKLDTSLPPSLSILDKDTYDFDLQSMKMTLLIMGRFTKTWGETEAMCNTLGGHLPSITSEDDRKTLQAIMMRDQLQHNTSLKYPNNCRVFDPLCVIFIGIHGNKVRYYSKLCM